MKPEKKAEKITGYVLLVLGLVLVMTPAILAILTFTGQSQIPQFIKVPTEASDFVEAIAVFSNACIFFFILLIIVWAGSIITSRGVTIIKDVKIKLVKLNLK
jgi:uncharacterized membrane protein